MSIFVSEKAFLIFDMKIKKINFKLSEADKLKALKKAQREVALKNESLNLIEKIQPSGKDYKRRFKHKRDWTTEE